MLPWTVLLESIRDCPYVIGALVNAPVGLLIARDGTGFNPMTVSCFSEAAHHPASIWVSISKGAYTHSLLERAPEFSFIALESHQGHIAVACGTASGRSTDKRDLLDVYENDRGFVFVKGALASTACRIHRSIPRGDHTLVLADMLSGDVDRRRGTTRNLLISDLQQS